MIPNIRVGLDARSLNVSHLRGMGAYLSALVARLGEDDGVGWSLFSNRPDLPLRLPRVIDGVRSYLFDSPGARLHLWEQVVLPAQARYDKVSVLHCPNNSLPLWQPVPVVTTIHDTIEWDEGQGWYLNQLLPKGIARCAAVITPSRHSRKRILERWPMLERKLHVIPHGVDAAFLTVTSGPLSPDISSLGVHEPYLLYCGGIAPRKRLGWALELFSAIEDHQLNLVICGVPVAHHESRRATLKPEVQGRVHFMPYVSTPAMARLYQNAVAILYPTLYEGFGFPALEAQAVGTPVLFTPHSSLADLVGPGAICLDADDRGEWVGALRQLLTDHQAGRPPNVAARKWARLFSWDEAVLSHLQIYRAAAARTRLQQ